MKQRWRDKPRPPLRQMLSFDLSIGLMAVGLWVVALQCLWAVVVDRDLGSAVPLLVAVAIDVPLTWFVVLYLRRPVPPEDLLPRAVSPADSPRAEAERRAWRSR